MVNACVFSSRLLLGSLPELAATGSAGGPESSSVCGSAGAPGSPAGRGPAGVSGPGSGGVDSLGSFLWTECLLEAANEEAEEVEFILKMICILTLAFNQIPNSLFFVP